MGDPIQTLDFQNEGLTEVEKHPLPVDTQLRKILVGLPCIATNGKVQLYIVGKMEDSIAITE